MLEGTEKWYESRSVWGGVVSLLSMLGGLIGYQVSPDDQEAVVLVFMGIGGSVGSALAIFGRVKATKTVE